MWSAPVIVTPPAGEPISLEDAKVFLRVDDDVRDVEISKFIAGARGSIESSSSTRLVDQVVKLSADSFLDLGQLPIGPVSAIISLAYLDAAGASVTIDNNDIELVGAGLEIGIRPVFGKSWPTAATRTGAVVVELNVGYDDIPADVDLALWIALRAEFEGKPADIDRFLVNHRIWLL